MYYNKYKLYYPDPSISGSGGYSEGDSEGGEGGEGENGTETGGGGFGDGGAGSPQQGDSGGNGLFTNTQITQQQQYLKTNDLKYIDIYDNRNFAVISPNGETRVITIKAPENTKFTLTIKDSTGCSVLKEKMEWICIPKGDKYIFQQDFPSININGIAIKKQEVYTITLTPDANVNYGGRQIELTQTANPTVRIATETSQSGPALSVSASGTAAFSGAAHTCRDYITPDIYTLTITGSDTETTESLYVKAFNINETITSNNTIKKVIDRNGEEGFVSQLILKPLTTRSVNTTLADSNTVNKGDDDYMISGDLKVGMVLYAKVEHTKTVKANLDKDGNVLDYLKCNTYTDKFELDNTNDLTTGMAVVSDDVASGTYISSIDCNKNITLLPKQIIKTNAALVFKQRWWATIDEVVSNINSDGNAHVKLSRSVDIPDNTEIEFVDPKTSIRTTIGGVNSGSDSIVLRIATNKICFGDTDTTYTVNLDNIITSKPNAYNQDVKIVGDKAARIYVSRNDTDLNVSSKTGAIVSTPKHGAISSYASDTDSFLYTPHKGFTGEDSFTFTMTDSVNTSDEKTVRIIVTKPPRAGDINA